MIKKLFMAIALLGVGVAGLGYYFWQQATMLPKWYQGQSSDSKTYSQFPEITSSKTAENEVVTAMKQKIQAQVKTTIQQQKDPIEEVDVSLQSEDFNQLVQSEVSSQLSSLKLTTLLPNVQTNIENNNLEIGTVINPAKLETLKLPRQQKAVFDRVLTQFPQLNNQDVYIGIEGKPKVKDGQLVLPNNSQVKIGKLTFTLSEVAQKLGVSSDRLQQSLNLNFDQLNLRDLQLNENKVTFKVKSSDYVPE